MTKKHFEALAAEMRFQYPADLGNGKMAEQLTRSLRAQWQSHAEGVADVCARFNPHFDRARFLKACGVEESK